MPPDPALPAAAAGARPPAARGRLRIAAGCAGAALGAFVLTLVVGVTLGPGAARIVAQVALLPVGLAIPLAPIVLAWYAGHRIVARRLEGIAALADAMRLRTVRDERPGKPGTGWYAGRYEELPFAIAATAVRDRSGHDGRSRWSIWLHVVMAVPAPAALDVVVWRAPASAGRPLSFERAFGTTHADRLSAAARDALLAFVGRGASASRLGHALGARGRNNVRLRDRAGADAAVVPPGVLEGRPVILTHDHPDPRASVPEVLALLAEMATVARAVAASPGATTARDEP